MFIRLKSSAKINFGLFILGKLDDNYHEILTIFQKIPFYDEIEIFESRKLEVEFIESEKVLYIQNNTILRAINEISKAIGKEFKLKIRVYKKIPIGGGLGGGSSNAGTILKFLNTFYSLGLSKSDLIEISKRVGSDVPFFVIDENCAIGMNRGDVLEPFKSNLKCYVNLFFPEERLSTSEMYSKIYYYDSADIAKEKISNIKLALETNNLELLKENMYNAFENVLDEKFLEYKKNLEKLNFDIVFLSGSGSTFVAISKSFKISSLWIEENS
ncbi:MAG: 4-(cytidine 5'-diphospho)-2-C-methyl-D-erythritol kinase [candidate division WOR-3 bacterium]|nr:4-(cytidine 5'-diphospho)-2-C-methyl-D-erythritol kinase [candidate division WOR-3 bacterium]MCX7947882.1 4-(cytidine 5'-diphospho)-2-C-methyl-D-erythritol kinase [candidate division WOR-3 bacterium]MDW8150704.1 4-(cytidine 5'-diphospho)-2-C-methyl-D-erythritol kinase [candidate division WOR-3 bacterium]